MSDRSETGGGRRARRVRRGVILVGLLLLSAVAARAHNLGDSYLYLQIYETSVAGRFEINLSDLNPALGLAGTDLEITAENLGQHTEFLKDYYLQKVSISDDRGPLEIRFSEIETLKAHGTYVLLPFELPGLAEVPDELTIEYSVLFDEEPDHRGFLLVEHNWATGTFANENQISLVFSPDDRRQVFDLTSSGRLRGFLAVASLGVEHMWKGLDHLMFVLALLLPIGLRREDRAWQPVEGFGTAALAAVKIATAFLVAHGLTLFLAALGWVRLPERLVESAIAASVVFAAVGLLVPALRRRLWWTVFGLSLFHGFGFASALADLGVLEEHRGLSVFAFNLGVDVGLVAVVAIVAPVVFLLRGWTLYRRWLLPIAAVGILVIGGIWTIERSFEVDVPMRELLPRSVQRVIP